MVTTIDHFGGARLVRLLEMFEAKSVRQASFTLASKVESRFYMGSDASSPEMLPVHE